MRYKNIKLNEFETGYEIDGNPVFKKYKKAMSFHAEGLAAVEDKTGCYHIKIDGTAVYGNRYNKSYGFYDKIAAVGDKNGSFHIDIYGNPLYDKRFIWIGNYQEEICAVESESGFYHIDTNGKGLYSERYSYVGDFRYGIAVVHSNDGAFHISKDGRRIHESTFEDADVFHKGFAVVKDVVGYFHINKLGEERYSHRFLKAEPFYNDYAFCTTLDGFKVRLHDSGNFCHVQKLTPSLDCDDIKILYKNGYKVALCIRHAERFEVQEGDPDWGEKVLLTEAGKKQASKLGQSLPDLKLCGFYSSPVERCCETAKYIGQKTEAEKSIVLGGPGIHWQEDRRLAEAEILEDGFTSFAIKYIKTGFASCSKPLVEGSELFLEFIRRRMTTNLSVFVTHDYFIAIMLDFLGLKKFDGISMCDFLEGFCIIERTDGSIFFRHFSSLKLLEGEA